MRDADQNGADCEIEFEKKANFLSNHRHPGVLSRREEATNEPESARQHMMDGNYAEPLGNVPRSSQGHPFSHLTSSNARR
jgi:hypothetical protein